MTVTGIGGLFLRCDNPKALAAWYAEHLGIGGGEWGLWSQQAGPTVFTPFAPDNDYFPTDRPFMLNLRVDDLGALIARLEAAGIDVITSHEWDDPQLGRFARIHDPAGNPLELWEAPPEPTA